MGNGVERGSQLDQFLGRQVVEYIDWASRSPQPPLVGKPVATLESKTSSFFDHRNPDKVKWLGSRKLDVYSHESVVKRRLRCP